MHADKALYKCNAWFCRYAVTLEIPKGSVQNAIFCDTADPHHSVRVAEGGAAGGGDLLVVSGEEHDQGISPETYTNVYDRYELAVLISVHCPGLQN